MHTNWQPEEIGPNVIFLDVDGVLNCATTECQIDGYVFLDKEKIEILKQVIEECHNPQIVLSSSWRWDYYHPPIYMTNFFYALIDELAEHGITVSALTADSHKNRNAEIKWFLDSNPQIERFIILDDDICYDFLARQVITDFQRGLTADRVHECYQRMFPLPPLQSFGYRKED